MNAPTATLRTPATTRGGRLEVQWTITLVATGVAVAGLLGTERKATAAGLVALGELRQGRMLEWRIDGVPAATNRFDPQVIAVDAEVTGPGGWGRRVPAFWYQPFRRALAGANEVLTPTGDGEWRLRGFGLEPGPHQVRVVVSTDGAPGQELVRAEYDVAAGTSTGGGFARVAADGQYFETAGGLPLPLVGGDVCWPGSRGTYDYDTWLPAMAASGWNWGRLWMWPISFGLETAGPERLNYRMDRAWQLDRVLDLAAAQGMAMLLCLDYHGMFESVPDYWGGNNYWPKHPYNVANGGPCATPREFFTQPAARRLYQARLRYLVARWGAHPGLFAWQFFNEIDNVYRYLDAAEVAGWHDIMGRWLQANDPWSRLRTTSLTSQSDRPEIWTLPSLDFTVYHAYSLAAPARRLAEVTASLRERYRKPVLIGEAGVDWRGWSRSSDPFLRGFRQLVWGGVFAGTAGTAMSWWWESIHAEDVYPYYRAITNVLQGTTWGQGGWEPVRFRESPPAPTTVGDLLAGGVPFDATLLLDGSWGTKPGGQLAVANRDSAGLAPQRLNGFVHGTAHPDLRVPCRIDAWWADGARLVAHLNSVSDGALFTVRVDGIEVFRRSLPNRDGKWEVNNEYNEDIAVSLAAGRHLVEVRNAGGDWFCLDWIRVEGVRPAAYTGDWVPAPAATGIRRGREFLVYLVAPGFEYPAQATVTNPPASGPHSLVLSNLPAGEYATLWFRTRDGAEVGRTTARTDSGGVLVLGTPAFSEDLVGHAFPPPSLRAEGFRPDGGFRVAFDGLRPEAFALESADVLGAWKERRSVREEAGGRPVLVDPETGTRPAGFYRVRLGATR